MLSSCMEKILVTGGTGTLGKQVVRHLLNEPFKVVVLSSQNDPTVPQGVQVVKGNLETNEGLKDAAKHAGIVIHCASNPKDPQRADVTGTINLLRSLDKDKTDHFVYISIVGVDKTNYPYYQAKNETEQIIKDSGIPFTILRTTQFHNLVLNMISSFQTENGHILVPPGMQFQSIDVSEVASCLAELAVKPPSGLLPDMGGPEILSIEEMVKIYLAVLGRRDEIKEDQVTMPRYDLFRSGVNLCPSNLDGKITWKQFLISTPSKKSSSLLGEGRGRT